MLRFARRCLALLPYAICFGAAAHFASTRPFAADRFEAEVMKLGSGNIWNQAHQMEWYARDPLTARVSARLLACRFPASGAADGYSPLGKRHEAFINVQVAAKSPAAVPNFIAAIENWNRVPRGESSRSTYRYVRALEALDSLAALADGGLPGAEEALRQLAHSYPPLPGPYLVSLPIYLRKGRSEAVLPWVRAEIDRARQVPGPWHPAWKDSRRLLSQLADGLAYSMTPESALLLGRIFDLQILDNEDITAPYGFLTTAPGRDYRFAVFDRVPAVPAFPVGPSLTVLGSALCASGRIASTLLPASEEDLREVPWLKKVLILVVCPSNGWKEDFPVLEALERDRGLIRETQSIDWSQQIRHRRIEDGSLPLEPGWEIVRTWSIQDLACQAQAAIRQRVIKIRAEREQLMEVMKAGPIFN